MEDWIGLAIAAGGGLLIGLLIGRFVARGRKDDAELNRLKKELEDYRESVAGHFAATAKKVNRMTESYGEVFEQLRSGAHDLIGEERLRELLADESGRTVTLGRLGFQEETTGSAAKAGRERAGGGAVEPHGDRAAIAADQGEGAAGAIPDAGSGTESGKTARATEGHGASGGAAATEQDPGDGEDASPGADAAAGSANPADRRP